MEMVAIMNCIVTIGMSIAQSDLDFFKALGIASDDSYDPNSNYSNEDDGYGVTWMYIPDGNGVPQIANLSGDPSSARGRDKNVKEHVYFELYMR